MTDDTLTKLFATIQSRKGADEHESYTAKLFAKGRAKIAQKLGEEAVETVIEAMRDDKQKTAEESADLLYHLLVLWADMGLNPKDIYNVIEGRMNVSGLDEKRGRKGGN